MAQFPNSSQELLELWLNETPANQERRINKSIYSEFLLENGCEKSLFDFKSTILKKDIIYSYKVYGEGNPAEDGFYIGGPSGNSINENVAVPLSREDYSSIMRSTVPNCPNGNETSFII